MEYVRVGNSGLKITEITYGTALTIGTESNDYSFAEELIQTAWEEGIRSFDTSNNYGNAELILGKVLSKYPREEFVLSTKGSWPIGETPYHRGLSRKHILWAFDESLKKLNMDYIDVYYAHRYDPDVSMEEIVRTFNYLIGTGRVRYWATSEWPLEALEECHKVCDRLGMEKPVIEQFIYSYAVRKATKNGVKSFCDERGVGTLGFSPLCQGYLTGKYRDGVPCDSRIAKSQQLRYDKTRNFYIQNSNTIDFFLATCEKYEVDPASVAIQWCVRKKIYPVVGASKPEQLRKNVRSLQINIPERLWGELETYDKIGSI